MNYLTIINNPEDRYNIERYEEEPLYGVKVFTSACSFEILVNDMYVYKFFSDGGLQGTEFPILNILESGTQELTIRLYPSIDEGKFYEKGLIKATKFKAIIKRGTVEDMMNDAEQEILTFELPYTKNDDGIEEYIEAGKDFAEYRMSFHADVPYKLNGWKDGKDLTKENPEKLEQEVLGAYKEYRDLIQNHNFDAIFKIMSTRGKEVNQAYYSSMEEIRADEDDYIKRLSNIDFEPIPFENYKMIFYGNGKVVSLERLDPNNYGESAIRFNYTTDSGEKGVRFFGLDLYKPNGSDKFVIIR